MGSVQPWQLLDPPLILLNVEREEMRDHSGASCLVVRPGEPEAGGHPARPGGRVTCDTAGPGVGLSLKPGALPCRFPRACVRSLYAPASWRLVLWDLQREEFKRWLGILSPPWDSGEIKTACL